MPSSSRPRLPSNSARCSDLDTPVKPKRVGNEKWPLNPLTRKVDLGLLKLPDIVKLHTCLLFYDILHDSKLSNLHLTFVSEQHNYSTRSVSSQSLQICPFRIDIRKFCPSVIGTYYWNDIPQSIRNKSSKQLFKRALQQYYFAQYWYLSILCTCVCVSEWKCVCGMCVLALTLRFLKYKTCVKGHNISFTILALSPTKLSLYANCN